VDLTALLRVENMAKKRGSGWVRRRFKGEVESGSGSGKRRMWLMERRASVRKASLNTFFETRRS